MKAELLHMSEQEQLRTEVIRLYVEGYIIDLCTNRFYSHHLQKRLFFNDSTHPNMIFHLFFVEIQVKRPVFPFSRRSNALCCSQ